jgi:DNA-binding NarL/FixJ family response regulator
MESIKVFIIDDIEIFRYGLINMLDGSSDINIIGGASDVAAALELLEKLRPHVILLDTSLPGMSAAKEAENIKNKFPCAGLIFLYTPEESSSLINALKYNESGFISKNSGKEEFIEAVKYTAAGGRYFDKNLIDNITSTEIENIIGGKNESVKIFLSERELQVIKLIYGGLHNKEIAGILGIGVRTVEKYKTNIVQKMGFKGNCRFYQNIYKSLAAAKI